MPTVAASTTLQSCTKPQGVSVPHLAQGPLHMWLRPCSPSAPCDPSVTPCSLCVTHGTEHTALASACPPIVTSPLLDRAGDVFRLPLMHCPIRNLPHISLPSRGHLAQSGSTPGVTSSVHTRPIRLAPYIRIYVSSQPYAASFETQKRNAAVGKDNALESQKS